MSLRVFGFWVVEERFEVPEGEGEGAGGRRELGYLYVSLTLSRI